MSGSFPGLFDTAKLYRPVYIVKRPIAAWRERAYAARMPRALALALTVTDLLFLAYWAASALASLAHGPGPLSLDALIGRRICRSPQ